MNLSRILNIIALINTLSTSVAFLFETLSPRTAAILYAISAITGAVTQPVQGTKQIKNNTYGQSKSKD